MAFLKFNLQKPVEPVIAYGRVALRQPRFADYWQWAELRRESEGFLRPWEPSWSEDEFSRAAFRRRIVFYEREWENATSYPMFIFADTGEPSPGERFVGGITLSNIRRGAAQTATLGYWIGARFARQGLMSQAVRAAVQFALNDQALHRIEAACLPSNTASRRLLEKSGFHYEGLARSYLKINGAWRDHLLYGLLADDMTAARSDRWSQD